MLRSYVLLYTYITDAVDYSKPQAKAVSDEVKIDTDTLSEEVHDILAVKGIDIL